jgi:hypothetical protein
MLYDVQEEPLGYGVLELFNCFAHSLFDQGAQRRVRCLLLCGVHRARPWPASGLTRIRRARRTLPSPFEGRRDWCGSDDKRYACVSRGLE